MLHAKVDEDQFELVGTLHLDLFFLQVGSKAPFGGGEISKFKRQAVDQVVLAIEEREPSWLSFLDHIHFDAIDHR